jgi:NADH dehydrogenase
MTRQSAPHHVVIVGGGFGGLYAAQRLRRCSGIRVTLIDRRNFHLFQPLLYQVATGGLSPANIAAPLRAVLRRQRNVEVLLAEVVNIDLASRTLLFHQGHPESLAFDTLIVAAGSTFNYFGHSQWQHIAPGLKSIEDALTIRSRVLKSFEAAELETDDERRRQLMTFVIVGGGPTGVELAGAIAEVAFRTLRHEFRRINTADTRILLVEALPTILGMFPEDLREKALEQLTRFGVMVRTGVMVTEIEPEHVVLKTGEHQHETIRARTILWTAGVKASPLAEILAREAGIELDRSGRVPVEADCSLAGHPDVFAIGDIASYTQDSKPLPALAPVAMQQGRYVAELIGHRVSGSRLPSPFRYRDKGTMATIGRSAAVADLGWIKLSGFAAWITWLLVHIMFLVQFQNRVMVMFQWAYSYFTRGRAARLITGEGRLDKKG